MRLYFDWSFQILQKKVDSLVHTGIEYMPWITSENMQFLNMANKCILSFQKWHPSAIPFYKTDAEVLPKPIWKYSSYGSHKY